MLSDLLGSLRDQAIRRVVVYDNGYETPEGRSVVESCNDFVDAQGWPFYRMWNHAWRAAKDSSFDAVALLNDDIVLHPGSLEVALDTMMSDPSVGACGLNYRRDPKFGIDPNLGFEETFGTYKDGGIWGCAFLLRSSLHGVVPEIDERYNLWYGDDELFLNVSKAGYKVGIALGSPVLHYASVSSNLMPEKLGLTGEDQILFLSKFGE